MSEVKVRGMRGADLGEIMRIAEAALPADPMTPETFACRVFLDQNYDQRGCVVAEIGDGVIAGFAAGHVRRHPIEDMPDDSDRSWIPLFAVHPGYRRRGIATQMFDALEGWFHSEGKLSTLIGPYTPNWWTPGVDVNAYPEALEFLAGRGYREVMRPLSMDSNLLNYRRPEWIQQREEALTREGVRFQTVRLEELPDLFSFLKREFPGDWQRHVRQTCLAVVRSGCEAVSRVRIALEASDEVVGFSHYDGERFGPFGTASRVRGRGIGAVLLAQTVEAMRAEGRHTAFFLWTEDKAAKLYAEAGFRESRRFSLMKKDYPE